MSNDAIDGGTDPVLRDDAVGRFPVPDLGDLREAGFDEKAIWDVAAVTAFYNLSNRLAMVADMRPNDEFHTLGRE